MQITAADQTKGMTFGELYQIVRQAQNAGLPWTSSLDAGLTTILGLSTKLSWVKIGN